MPPSDPWTAFWRPAVAGFWWGTRRRRCSWQLWWAARGVAAGPLAGVVHYRASSRPSTLSPSVSSFLTS